MEKIPASACIHQRLFWLLLIGGFAVRCVALTQPLVDAHLLRQCQTAAATQSLMAEPGLSFRIPWAGDLDERYACEMPVYNYLAIAANWLIGNLTVAGKLVSIALWALSFWLLQFIWRRALDPAAAAWANLLFVLSPLGVFYGQAFMADTLVQALAFGFLLLLIRYNEKPTLLRWVGAAAAGLAALLVTAPKVAHLYLVFVLLTFARGGWRCLLLPRHVVAGIVSAACVAGWSAYMDATSRSVLSFGGAGENLRGFVGPLSLRFDPKIWLMIAAYIAFFVVPGPALLAVLGGAIRVLRKKCTPVLAAWLVSIAVFYLAWLGNGPSRQSYYNLPALAPLAALFGIGMRAMLESPRLQRWRTAAAGIAVTLTLGCAIPVWIYLFTPDRVLLGAAQWAREHTQPGSLIILRAAHRPDMKEYAANAVFPFYAERPAFVWTTGMPEPYRSHVLERASHAVVTKPPPEGRLAAAIRKLRGSPAPAPENTDWLRDLGFTPVADGEGFTAFRRQ